MSTILAMPGRPAVQEVQHRAVLVQSVSARRREIGIHMALGAGRIRVIGLIARESATLLLAGVPLGILRGDPLALGMSVVVLALVAGLASWLPARRAAFADAVVALQSE